MPVIRHAINKALRQGFGVEIKRSPASKKPYNEQAPINYQDVLKLVSAVDAEACVFQVPIERCVWGYGWRFAKSENPYTQFYDHPGTLDQFYARYCPTTLEEAFAPLGGHAKRQNFSTPLKDPLLKELWEHSYQGDEGLGAEHGEPHSGPISPQLLALEKKRLMALLQSVQKNGWKPELYDGYIRGFFLVSGGEFLFKVTGGQHRAAVLSQLGWTHIPVIFQSGYPRVISPWNFQGGDVHVTNSDDALKILRYYFDETLRQERKHFLETLLSEQR